MANDKLLYFSVKSISLSHMPLNTGVKFYYSGNIYDGNINNNNNNNNLKVLSLSYKWIYLIAPNTQWESRYYYYYHVIFEETEAQRGSQLN